MKPKQQTNNDAIGEEALRLLIESGTVVSGVALADMHAAKKARKTRLKEVLTIIWNGYEQGLTFNGQPTKEAWAANFAKVSIRHIQHQVFGRTPSEANNRSLAINFDKLAEAITQGRKVNAIWGGNKYGAVKIVQYRGVIHISVVDVAPVKGEKKPTRLIHIPDLRTAMKAKQVHLSLCDVSMKNRAKNNEQPNCPKCLEIAKTVDNKLMVPAPVAPKVKKLSALDTQAAIDKVWHEIISKTRDEMTDAELASGPQRVLDKFNEAVAQHPEWLPSRVQKKMSAAKDHVRRLEQQNSPIVRVKLTEPQMREVRTVGVPTTVFTTSKLLVFHADYEETAKSLVLELEKHVESLHAEAGKQKKTLKDYNDKSPENVAAFEEQARLQGSIKACDGAIRAIVFGDMTDDTARNIVEWHEKRTDERLGLSDDQPALTLVIADKCPTEGEK